MKIVDGEMPEEVFIGRPGKADGGGGIMSLRTLTARVALIIIFLDVSLVKTETGYKVEFTANIPKEIF